MSIDMYNVSFGNKFSEQKAARLVDKTHKQAVNLMDQQRPIVEQPKKLILTTTKKIANTGYVKALAVLDRLLNNSYFKYMEKMFR